MTDHDFLPVNGHPDDNECTHREDGTDATYCGEPKEAHHPMTDQTPSTEDVRKIVAEAVRAAVKNGYAAGRWGGRIEGDADALINQAVGRLAARDREVAAKALRDAATALQLMDAPWPEPIYSAVQEWLNSRADHIAAGDG